MVRKCVISSLVLSLLFFPTLSYSSQSDYFNKVVEAIYLAEGGKSAKKPFGVLSIPCSDYSDCRKICYNTVRNNWKRWQKSDKSLTYLEFLAKRYAPVGVSNDPNNLNRNWLRNVQRLLK